MVGTIGPYFGYYTNVCRTHLVVKPDLVDETKTMFEDTNVQITVNGQRHLGAAIGIQEFIEAYVAQMITKWISEIDSLVAVACSYPHAAYSAFVHGVIGRSNHSKMPFITNLSLLWQVRHLALQR